MAAFLRICSMLTCCIWTVSCGCMEGPRRPQEVLSENYKYMSEDIGAVVIDYFRKHGTMPETFDDALSEFEGTLPHRGDAFGKGLFYRRISNVSCIVVSIGNNNRFDMGKGDDLVVKYSGGWQLGSAQDVDQAFLPSGEKRK